MQKILQKIAHNVQKIADNMQYRYVHTSIYTGLLYDIYNYVTMYG